MSTCDDPFNERVTASAKTKCLLIMAGKMHKYTPVAVADA